MTGVVIAAMVMCSFIRAAVLLFDGVIWQVVYWETRFVFTWDGSLKLIRYAPPAKEDESAQVMTLPLHLPQPLHLYLALNAAHVAS